MLEIRSTSSRRTARSSYVEVSNVLKNAVTHGLAQESVSEVF